MNVLARDWAQARARAQELLGRTFNEAEHPRDDHGKWTDGGGSDDGGGTSAAKTSLAKIASDHSDKPPGSIGAVSVDAYRRGAVKDAGRGIFFGQSAKSVEGYQTDQPVKKYRIEAKNALVARNHQELHEHLFDRPFSDAVVEIGVSKEAVQQVEARMAEEVRSRGHDALIYSKTLQTGEPEIGVLDQSIIKELPDDPEPEPATLPAVTAYHGSTSEVARKIATEGITVRKGKTYAKDDGEGSHYVGERGQSVYITTDHDEALRFAAGRAHKLREQKKREPNVVVFEMKIPRAEWDKFKQDEEHDSAKRTTHIPPGALTEYRVYRDKSRWDSDYDSRDLFDVDMFELVKITELKALSDEVTRYFSFVVVEDETKKAWRQVRTRSEALLRLFNPSQLRDELGRWADAGGSEDRVSTTVPTAAKQGFDPHKRQDLAPTYDTFKKALENPKYAAGVEKLMDAYGKAFLRAPKDATVAQKAELFVSHATANLTALYNAQDPELRGRSATWYRGARKIADDFSKQYGVSPRAVAGVLASLSPQRDWDQNVEMAKRVLDIAVVNGKIPIEGEKAARTKTAMLDYAQLQLDDADKIEAKLPENPDPKDPAIRGQLLKIENRRDTAAIMNDLAERFEGKKLSDLPNRAEQAMVLRFYDEGNADPNRAYAIWNPEGTPSGEVAMAGKPGKEKIRQSGWGGFGMTADALSILADDSRENISASLGGNHKVRNFYNNIISPEYGQDTTIDTHAIAAALLMPLGGGASQVKEGLGMSGPKNADTGLKSLYALYSEAYRRAAKTADILPREMQSTTWEALRGLFSPEEKRDAKLEAAVKDTWARYQKGTIDLAEAQREILARGIKPPRWAT